LLEVFACLARLADGVAHQLLQRKGNVFQVFLQRGLLRLQRGQVLRLQALEARGGLVAPLAQQGGQVAAGITG